MVGTEKLDNDGSLRSFRVLRNIYKRKCPILPLYLSAELAAEFISRPQNQEVVEGQKAEFTCSVSKETFEVKWMKGDKQLEAGDKYQMVSDGKRRTLVIKETELKDEGGYVVVIGATRAGADLTVRGKLHPHTQPSDPNRPRLFSSSSSSSAASCRKTEDRHPSEGHGG